MKKHITIFLILIMTLIMAGCSDTVETNNTTSSDLTSFTTIDLNGETVTEDIFADYDITMVNVWATWCGPCVNEFPALGELKRQLPENYNLITICTDGNRDSSNALNILSSNNADFTVLIPSEELENGFLSTVDAIPTTIFVDSNGNLVGSRQLGAPGFDEASIIDGYMELIENAYSELK
jgi:thiol-disulfide isomerase/thioredoxin